MLLKCPALSTLEHDAYLLSRENFLILFLSFQKSGIFIIRDYTGKFNYFGKSFFSFELSCKGYSPICIDRCSQ